MLGAIAKRNAELNLKGGNEKKVFWRFIENI